jgi:hypothetical protein
MASDATRTIARFPWRAVGWGGAAALLALPFAAMQFTREVDWTGSDFAVFAAMLLAAGIPIELAVRANSSWAYRGGVALASLGAFLTVWANLAVGIVGSEDNPANILFFGALLVGLVGAIGVRAKAKGMAAAMLATAAALGAAFVISVSSPTDEPAVSHVTEALGTGLFALLFVASAALFRKAARKA